MATIKGTLPAPVPAGVVSSVVTVIETLADGTAQPSTDFPVSYPDGTFTFSASVGSTLSASQVDLNSAGVAGPPFVTTYVVPSPTPPATPAAPVGPIVFEVVTP